MLILVTKVILSDFLKEHWYVVQIQSAQMPLGFKMAGLVPEPATVETKGDGFWVWAVNPT